ncbi:hypothetical protein COLO4_25497 [Corchorus olitorius]|uniref:Uncharacterized protein n=1 Tax=Corchorus olitorius TaxID=93759 RepID=A0A1R3I260_9ROSI|nr:hypothetical protein COLO4_25497 [Corchorus olitorius]
MAQDLDYDTSVKKPSSNDAEKPTITGGISILTGFFLLLNLK